MIRSNLKNLWLAGAVSMVALLPAQGATLASLHDWCFNIDGASVSTNLCNTGQTTVTVPGGVNGALFDFTLDSQTEGSPATPFAGYPTTVNDANTLGSLSITLAPGANQFVLAYMDYDLNYNAQGGGSFSDFGSVHGAQPGNVSFSMNGFETCNSCGFSDIYDEFASNTLDNTNHVGTYVSDGVCCDVAWALGMNLNVAANTTATVTFRVGTIAPETGFYLQQSNGLDQSQNIYLTASVLVTETGPQTPEPSTWALIGGGLAAVALFRRRIVKA